MIIVGLTGGMASGKSTAAQYLGTQGAHVIDADILGHRAYDPGTAAFKGVVAAFGEDIVGDDGQIDRRALGGKVFGKPDQLTRLTDIVWPEIKRMALGEIEAVRKAGEHAVVVLEAAVLLEAGWHDIVDEVWVVTVEPDTAVARAMARDGVDEAAVRSRLAAQLSNEERHTAADVIIDNSGDEAALTQTLNEAWQEIVSGKRV